MVVSSGRAPSAPIAAAGRLPLPDQRRYKPRNSHPLSKDEIMAIERTFSIIKPDATARNLTGAINALIEKAGLRIVAQKRIRMTREQAETFYAVHKARPFFGELVDFMTSGPGRRAGAGRRGRRAEVPRRHGRDRSVQGGRRHHPQAACKVDRRELGAWFGCRRRPRRSKSPSFSRATKSSADRNASGKQ